MFMFTTDKLLPQGERVSFAFYVKFTTPNKPKGALRNDCSFFLSKMFFKVL